MAWVTEWNVWHGSPLLGTWANGLSDAEYLLALLGEPRVRQEDLHALINRQPFAALFANAEGFGANEPATVPFAPTAVGRPRRDYPLLSGGPSVRQLTVQGRSPHSGTRFAAIQAVAIQGRGALLLNLTGHKHRVRLADGPACEGRWTRSGRGRAPGSRVTPGRSATGRSRSRPLSLPPYSVNRLDC